MTIIDIRQLAGAEQATFQLSGLWPGRNGAASHQHGDPRHRIMSFTVELGRVRAQAPMGRPGASAVDSTIPVARDQIGRSGPMRQGGQFMLARRDAQLPKQMRHPHG